jgi:mannose-6-phosphate isomerase-like protein (cupin superfamily)
VLQPARLEDRESFITADGSSIRELAGIPTGNAANQSLAEATVPPGGTTIEHFHRTSEEIYLFTRGMGRMHLGDQDGPVRAGDAVVIAPGTRHKLVNTGPEPLVLLCCCSPAYSHEDTVLVED